MGTALTPPRSPRRGRPATAAPAPRKPARQVVFGSNSPSETRSLGRQLGRRLCGEETIALSGPLGSGKTCLVQGVGRGLNVTLPINSPSYVLMKRYRGRVTLTHWDWYRLADTADLESCGFGDPQMEPGVVVIEWAERFLDQIEPPFLHIELALTGWRSRRLTMRVRGRSARLGRLIRELKKWWMTSRDGRPGTRHDPGH